jgi:hypothetical protein
LAAIAEPKPEAKLNAMPQTNEVQIASAWRIAQTTPSVSAIPQPGAMGETPYINHTLFGCKLTPA